VMAIKILSHQVSQIKPQQAGASAIFLENAVTVSAWSRRHRLENTSSNHALHSSVNNLTCVLGHACVTG